MLASLIKAFVATTLLTGSVGKPSDSSSGELAKSFLGLKSKNTQKSSFMPVGPYDDSVFSFEADLKGSDITVTDAKASTSEFSTTNVGFPLGNKNSISPIIQDPAFRRYLQNSAADNSMKKLAYFRDAGTIPSAVTIDESPITVQNNPLLTKIG